MKENGGTFRCQAAEAKGNNHCITNSVHSESLCNNSVNKCRTDSYSVVISTRKARGKKYSPRHISINKSRETRKDKNISKSLPRSRSSRDSSIHSNIYSHLPYVSSVNDIPCNKDKEIPILNKELFVSLDKVQKPTKFDGIKAFGLKTELEYLRCKQAIVCLKDCFKVEKGTKNGIINEYKKHIYPYKMKQVGSRSPKGHSPVRGSVSSPGSKDTTFVRTTYTKPTSKDSFIDDKPLNESKAHCSASQDGLVPDKLACTGSPKVKKKVSVAMKKDIVGQEQMKVTKKRNPVGHGDSVVAETENADTKRINIDSGQGDTDNHKDSVETEKTNSPKKRGRKPKSAESSPVKVERKNSESNSGNDANATPGIVITPSKDDRKISKTPRSKKKRAENEISTDSSKQDFSSGNEKLTVKKNSRLSSESPSPGRRKRSPKFLLEEKDQKSNRRGTDKKSKTDKFEIDCNVDSDIDESNQEVIDINDSHVDEVIEDVVNRNNVDKVIEDVVNRSNTLSNKESLKKSSSRKNKKPESLKKKMISPNTEKRSQKKNSQDNETCSDEKKKPRSRSNSASPKKEKKRLESISGESENKDNLPLKKLDFDDHITQVMKEKSILPFPSDFQYKYTSSRTGCLGLNDLISKVDSSVKNKDDNLTALFGKVETEYNLEETSPSSNDTEVNISTDSDKTIIEFEDVQENSSKDDEISEGKESEECAESSFDNDANDSSEKLEESDGEKIEADESDKELNTKFENSDVKSDKRSKESRNLEYVNCDTEADSGNKMIRVSNKEKPEVDDEKEIVKTVSVFEMFGLTLRKHTNENELKEEKTCDTIVSDNSVEDGKNKQKENNKTCKSSEKVGDDDEDVMFVSESKPGESIVIVSDDDEEEHRGIDRSGFESLKETFEEKKLKPKLTTINNVVEPKPLDILHKLERADSKKENAFTCNELDEYLDINKENIGLVRNTQHSDNELYRKKDMKINIKAELKKAEPDFDEIDGHVFICFATESVLKAHVSLEKKTDWLTEAQLRKMAYLKHMKERQQDLGTRRLKDVKCGDEQKQNFRGIPMRMMKYQKMLKQELEDMLLGRQPRSPEKSPSKTPTKTSDIRKIKGWKKKFHNQEEIQEATGLNISETGKVHWKTEERLVKNLDPEEIKDIGLDLKKKRRKLVNYSNKKKSGNEEKEAEMMEYEYEIDDLAIIESDVYNEDEDKPPPDKIPYSERFSSQYKYGARKLFVKRMKLDAEDERILQKLGTQKQIGHKTDVTSLMKRKKGKQTFTLLKLTHTMAVAAVSALNSNLLKRAKGMDKTDSSRKTKKDARSAKKGTKTPVQSESPEIKEEVDPDNYFDNEDDYQHELETEKEEHVEDKVEGIQREEESRDDENEAELSDRKVLKKRRHSSACRGRNNRRNSISKGADDLPEDLKVEIKREIVDTCTEPGCRYGCICHLCKLSDSGEEKETDFKPPCDKEYCRLGCICDSIDTKSADTEHCRKPGCMFKCKCPPKQPKPDIPREREHGKKKKGRGGKKKKRSPEKAESEQSGKEEDVGLGDDNDWEPPNKRKRGPTNSRFANLPKRETTYRLAKNLDAVSRKAMEVYASSEMFTEQKMRKRRSDLAYEDCFYMSPELKDSQEKRKSAKPDSKQEARLNEETGVLEISDEESDDEVFPEGLESCSRIQPYTGPYKPKRDLSQLNKRKGGTGSSSKKLSNTVIDLVDSDKEDNSGDNKSKIDLPSTSSGVRPQSLTEKMGLTNRLQKTTGKEKSSQDKTFETKWKTQMVCLKAKKKSDDKSEGLQSEIKLLEIMSNCNWEIDRTNMLSKISHIISKDYMCDASKSTFISWGAYLLEFLPKADKPAVIPPELKSKLPSEMYSIRIKVTNNVNKDEKVQKADDSVTIVDVDKEDSKPKELSEEDKKKINIKLQKKLIDKIKFAERLRNQIIVEEQKGVTTSKFSVSREGIEKALKKYKTQLWKAYTGSSNFTIQQLKQALHAAKSSGAHKQIQSGKPVAEAIGVSPQAMSTSTLERIQSNQGVTVVTSSGETSSHHSFINLSHLQQEVSSSNAVPIKSVGNIVIHGHIPKPNQGIPNQGKGFNDNIENIKKYECSSLPSGSQSPSGSLSASKIHPLPTVSQSVNTKLSSTDVVLMPLDKNIHPSQLPPGAKVTFMQPVLNRDGSPVPFSVGQQTIGGAPIRAVVLPNASQMPSLPVVRPFINPTITSLPSTRPPNPQNFQSSNLTGVPLSTAGSILPLTVPATSMNGVFTNGTCHVIRPGIQQAQYVASVTLPSSSTLQGLPLKNISNLGPVVSSENAGATLSVSNGSTVSPGTSSICPIKIGCDSPEKMGYMVPGPEMIGFPKVASVPFKLVPDGKGNQMMLVPVTSTIMPNSTGTPLSGKDVVNIQDLPMPTTSLSRRNSTSPLIFAVPVSDSTVVQNVQEQAASAKASVISRRKASTDIKQNNSEENGLCKPGPNISENNIAQEKKTSLDKEEILDNSNNGNSFDTERKTENGDKDYLTSCTKNLSSPSDVIDTDTDMLDGRLNESSCIKEKTEGRKTIENSKVTDVLNITKKPVIEMSNSFELPHESYKERDDTFDNRNERKETNQNIEKESKKDPECVVLDDSDEEPLLIDKNNEPRERIETKADGEQSMKSKKDNLVETERRTPDIVDSIDWEHEIKMMENYMENEQNDRNKSNSVEKDAIKVEESEDSDVDVTSCDTLDLYPDIAFNVEAGTSKPVPTSNKRKSQLTMMPHDDFEIKKLKLSKEPSTPMINVVLGKNCKMSKEKLRRQQLRNLFKYAEKVVFKYNHSVQGMEGKIPRHAILQEALNLISALKQRQDLLLECLEDGQQYERTLESQLKQQIDSFCDSGVPVDIIRNFLKSVEKSVLPRFKRKKKSELPGVSNSEENDSVLEYEQLTPGKFQDIYLFGDTRLMGELRVNEEANDVILTDSFPTGANKMKTGTSSVEMKTGAKGVSVTPAPVKIFSGNCTKESRMPYVNVFKERNQGVESNDANSVVALNMSDSFQNSENAKMINNETSVGVVNSDIVDSQQDCGLVNNSDLLNISCVSRNTNISNIHASELSSSVNSHDEHVVFESTRPIIIEASPKKSNSKGCVTLSSSGTVTPGQKSSSDEDEIRSSTGDALMDDENDFINNDQWGESQSEEQLQIDNTML